MIVGASSFGGYSALIAVVEKIFVEKLKVIKDTVIVQGFSLASLLPGPVAVNTVTYIGFKLGSWPGALVSLVAVVLPSMILMIILSIIYQHVGVIPEVQNFLLGVVPVIMALIISVILKMGKGAFDNWPQWLILFITLALQYFFSGYWVFFIAILSGAILGLIFYAPKEKPSFNLSQLNWQPYQIVVLVFLLISLLVNFVNLSNQPILIQLFSVFSGVSLTLFGGGYVMIPMLEELIVEQYGWLSQAEFLDAIVLGQATPGPILISATFVGYQVAGLLGAIVSTIAIFLPSALLITLIADLFSSSQTGTWEPIIRGIKPVVVGLMLSSLWILLQGFDNYIYPIFAAVLAAFLIIRFKVHFLWLILVSGIIGVLIL